MQLDQDFHPQGWQSPDEIQFVCAGQFGQRRLTNRHLRVRKIPSEIKSKTIMVLEFCSLKIINGCDYNYLPN